MNTEILQKKKCCKNNNRINIYICNIPEKKQILVNEILTQTITEFLLNGTRLQDVV